MDMMLGNDNAECTTANLCASINTTIYAHIYTSYLIQINTGCIMQTFSGIMWGPQLLATTAADHISELNT